MGRGLIERRYRFAGLSGCPRSDLPACWGLGMMSVMDMREPGIHAGESIPALMGFGKGSRPSVGTQAVPTVRAHTASARRRIPGELGEQRDAEPCLPVNCCASLLLDGTWGARLAPSIRMTSIGVPADGSGWREDLGVFHIGRSRILVAGFERALAHHFALRIAATQAIRRSRPIRRRVRDTSSWRRPPRSWWTSTW